MSVSALAYVDRIPQWTANNIVDTYTDGDYTVNVFHELELQYGGHFGKGFWIVTGDYRVTDLTNLGAADIFLWNETTELTYGVCGGYVYDTEWKNFSIVAGWSSDLPSTMHLRVALYDEAGADDIVEFRNVRLAFVQIADVNGLKVTGRDMNTAGYHQQACAWDYSGIDPIAVFPAASANLAVMTANSLPANTYVSFFHINGLNCYGGVSAANNSDMRPRIEFNNGSGGFLGRKYTRVEPGHYPSYGWVNDRSVSANGSLSQYIRLIHTTGAPEVAEFDLYGGWFMMLMSKAADIQNQELDDMDTVSGATTVTNSFALNTNTAASAAKRFLSFGSGAYGLSSNSANVTNIVVVVEDDVLHQGKAVYKGGASYQNYRSWFTFGNEPMAGNTSGGSTLFNLQERLTSNTSTTLYYGPTTSLGIELDRDYVNSTTGIPAQANNQGSASQTWGSLSNLYSANVTHYAAMANVSTTAANNAYLKVTNFGFDEFIPEGSEIGYIWMMPVYRKQGTGAIQWDNVRMVADGSVVGSSCAWSTPWATSWTYVGPDINYGVTTYWDLDFNPAAGGTASRDGIWNYRPTASQVRASNFGFQMRCKSTSGTPTAQVAYVFAVVYYRAPGETFMRSVTCAANSIAVASMGAKDVSKGTSTTAAQTASALKATVPVVKTDDFSANVAAFTKAATKPFSGVVGNVVSIGRTFTKGLSVAANNVATNIKAITRTTIGDSANTTATIGRAINKPNSFTMQQFWVGHKDTVKAALTASANSTATASKNTTKPSSLTQGKTVSFLKAITKPRAIVAASAKTLRKNVVKPVANTFSSTVALFDAHKLYHYILDLGTTVVATATVQKAIAATRSTTQATSGSLAVNWNYILNITAATFGSTASIVKTPIKNAAITAPSVKTIRKAATHALATTAGASATIVKRPLKAVATTVGTTVSRVRSIAKGFTKTAPSTKTFRKNAGKTVASSFTASVNGISKAATRRLAITQGTTRTVLKAITRPYSKVAASIKTFRKNAGKPVTATAEATASVRKTAILRLSATAVQVAEIQKGITRRVAAAVSALVETFTAEKQSRTKYLRWVTTAFEGFRETANSVLRQTTETAVGAYEYITYTTHAVAAPDSTTWQAPAVEAHELKPSHTDTTELKL